MWGNGNFPLIYYITQEAPKEYYFRFKILPSLNEVSLKISCLFLTELSHDTVESSLYIPRDHSHMRTTEIELNLCAAMAKKRLTTLKRVPLMIERNAFGCIIFFEYRVHQ